jgi:hypothetical protein
MVREGTLHNLDPQSCQALLVNLGSTLIRGILVYLVFFLAF